MRLQALKYAVLSLLAVPAAFANTATLATLNPSGNDSVGAYTFTVSGASNPDFGCNCLYFAPNSTYTSSADSTYPAYGSIVQIAGDNTVTLTFSAPVSGLVLYEFSLGGLGTETSYTFNAPFTVLSEGINGLYRNATDNNGNFTVSGNTLTGNEANGTIEFTGPVSSLSIDVNTGENYNGFEVGVINPTPEPESLVMVGTGLIGLAGLVRRRISR